MSSTIKVRFLVDIEKKRVAFAEAGSDFVDVLFSFLTLPLGSIVRLLGKQSCLGSLDNLYESVEQLDAKHLQTDACKDMLLNPRSAAAIQCEDLKIEGIHELEPRSHYTCSQEDCLIQSTCYYTYSSMSLCSCCGKPMDKGSEWSVGTSEKGGVFVNETINFLITDDLQVIPTSLLKGFSLLKQMQIKDSSMLEERFIDFGTKEVKLFIILNILRRSLVSKKVLTDVCFSDACMHESVGVFLPLNDESFDKEGGKEISLKLVLNKENNNILYAEVGDDFANLLFSFLTFPFGSVLRLVLDNLSLGGCINNLYSSVNSMGLDCFKSELCRNILMAPKLSTFQGYKNQLLEVEEITSTKSFTRGSCAKCYMDNEYKRCKKAPCIHGIRESEDIELNPKLAKGVPNNDGAFVAGSRRFMITDDLHISLLSAISAVVNGQNLPIYDVVEKEVFVDKYKARSLLSAILASRTVLTDIFAPKPTSRKRSTLSYA
ncbi:hypothetical protein KSP39_PZI022659 [Platanthera zijinensis]|uniref:DUF674 family protein n=1 Tax=Platanthera zijinensis TaxID=2320716 RepID=A0AAP0FV96_9ASPA